MLSLPVVQAGITELDRRGSVPRAPLDTPEGLSCDLPQRWMTRVNQPYPRSPLVVSRDRVYTSSDRVYALDKATGKELWRFTPHGDFIYEDVFNGNGITVVKLDGDVLYFGGWQKALYALDAQTGKELWNVPLERGMLESIEFDKERVYVSNSRKAFAINKRDGSLVWSFDLKRIEGEFHAPRLADGKLFVLSGQVLYALDARTGQEVWTYSPDIEQKTPEYPKFVYGPIPHIYKNQIIVIDADKNIVAVDVSTGKEVWRADGKPIAFGVYMTTTPEDKLALFTGSTLGQFNVSAQKMDWWYRPMFSGKGRPVAFYKNAVIFGTDAEHVYAIDRNTGDEVFRFAFDENTQGVRTVVVDGDQLYFLGGNGGVYAYDLKCPQLTP